MKKYRLYNVYNIENFTAILNNLNLLFALFQKTNKYIFPNFDSKILLYSLYSIYCSFVTCPFLIFLFIFGVSVDIVQKLYLLDPGEFLTVSLL